MLIANRAKQRNLISVEISSKKNPTFSSHFFATPSQLGNSNATKKKHPLIHALVTTDFFDYFYTSTSLLLNLQEKKMTTFNIKKQFANFYNVHLIKLDKSIDIQ